MRILSRGTPTASHGHRGHFDTTRKEVAGGDMIQPGVSLVV